MRLKQGDMDNPPRLAKTRRDGRANGWPRRAAAAPGGPERCVCRQTQTTRPYAASSKPWAGHPRAAGRRHSRPGHHRKYIDGGLRYVIIGTAAVKNPGFLKDACSAFGGHIIVGLDAKDGKVATDGWSKLTGHEVMDLAQSLRTGASNPSSTPTLAATACSRASTSRPPSSWPRR